MDDAKEAPRFLGPRWTCQGFGTSANAAETVTAEWSFLDEALPAINHVIAASARKLELGLTFVMRNAGGFDRGGVGVRAVNPFGGGRLVAPYLIFVSCPRFPGTRFRQGQHEFGRTPKINQYVSRDHWPRPDCYSVLLAGGGVMAG